MVYTEKEIIAKQRRKVLGYNILYYFGIICLAAIIANAIWMGYLSWSHIQVIDPPAPEMIPIYTISCVGLTGLSVALFLMLSLWQNQIHHATENRDAIVLIAHFMKKYFGVVAPAVHRCNSSVELMRELQAAGVVARESMFEFAAQLDETMYQLRSGETNEQYQKLYTLAEIIDERTAEKIEMLEAIEIKLAKDKEAHAALVSALNQEATLAEQIQHMEQDVDDTHTGIIRLKQPNRA